MIVDETKHHRELLDQFLRSTSTFPTDRFHGRGIVLCGGGSVYFPCIWVCVRMLRRFGNTLPIELWHRGPRELTDEMRRLLEPHDVFFQDAFEVAQEHPVRRLDGWELKPYAILNSRFSEVLYIDADNVVVRNPEFLFETPLYQETGSLFWQDLPNHTLDQSYLKDHAWELLGLTFRDEAQFESGQLLVDKRRCWRALQLTLHLNEHSDFYYTAFFGDKDTFHLAWRKVGQEYSLNPHPPGVLGANWVLVQFDSDGKRLFQHRCNAKWTITGQNFRIPGFLFEDECLALLQELPESFEPAPLSAVEEAAIDEIVNGVCEFKRDHTVMLDGQLFGWEVEEDHAGAPVLIITQGGRRACFLRKVGDTWTGHWRYGDRPLIQFHCVRKFA